MENSVMEKQKRESKKVNILNNDEKFTSNELLLSGNLWNYFNSLINNLNYVRFKGYFNKTLYLYPRFKNSDIKRAGELSDYFRRCQLLSILQGMAFLNNSLSFLGKNQFFIKIGPSKNEKKNCVLIDDSTVLNNETNELRETLGTEDELHRGFKMFNELNYEKRNDFIYSLHVVFNEFCGIINLINNDLYVSLDPVLKMVEIVNYCKMNDNNNNMIYYLASEINDNYYDLSIDEVINLFNDVDNLYKLWNSGFVSDNQGKLRILILSIYFDKFILKN
jgi:hypothetical protein